MHRSKNELHTLPYQLMKLIPKNNLGLTPKYTCQMFL